MWDRGTHALYTSNARTYSTYACAVMHFCGSATDYEECGIGDAARRILLGWCFVCLPTEPWGFASTTLTGKGGALRGARRWVERECRRWPRREDVVMAAEDAYVG